MFAVSSALRLGLVAGLCSRNHLDFVGIVNDGCVRELRIGLLDSFHMALCIQGR